MLFVAIRLGVAVASDIPTITPDELGSWAIARHLAGVGGELSMADMPRYPLVGGAVLAPVEWLGLGPAATYRVGLVVMSLIVVAAAILLRRATALLAPRQPVLAAAAYGLTLLFPATVVTTSFTWAEPTVLACWAVLCWAAVALWVRPATSVLALVSGAIAAGLAPFVHGRFLFVPVIWAAMLVWNAWWRHRRGAADGADGGSGDGTDRRRRAWPVLASLVVLVAVTAAARRIDIAVGDAVWSGGAGKDRSHVLNDLGTPELWGRLIMVAIGQLWYSIVASMGLAVAGVAGIVAVVRRPPIAAHRPLALLLLTALASVYVTSIGVMTSGIHRADGGIGEGLRAVRWDHHLYGRYVDAGVLILSIAGVATLWHFAGRTWALRIQVIGALAALAGGVAVALRLAGTEAMPLKPFTIAGLTVWTGDSGSPQVTGWTTAGVLTALAIGVAARSGRERLVQVTSALVVLGALLGGRTAMQMQHDNSAPDLITEVGDAPEGGGDLVVASDAADLPYLRVGVFALQFQFLHAGWDVELSRLDSDSMTRLTADPDAARAEGRSTVLVVKERSDSPGDDWELQARFEGAELWRRD